ncbi:hypothetical protein K493DRAFT_315874 [Basidiobolus meristosporus CBS 931.73]|uniref:Uncharacterized protein n=1 Tax=Basidiobolus meristosporus CBS 931.73 TaxID=1314790 RepID=A0A1Y1Y6L4_9FUNG|nr:hypothetical protein K493DRAFT_315874 [Basidiobolus meristosporus CBS 931.73]|eukprot:ORX93652.1 hypothetical protein K493DRAFT_315874 [Basidiobolus meristosporus CBS 931.73]
MDTNWCTVCDKHIDFDGLYCSQTCRLQDASTKTNSAHMLMYGNRRHSVSGYRPPPQTPTLLSPSFMTDYQPHNCGNMSSPSSPIGQNLWGRTYAKRLSVS